MRKMLPVLLLVVAATPALAVSDNEMASYCRGEVAGKYNTRPAYVTTGSRDTENGIRVVPGSVDRGNKGTTKFKCQFSKSGNFLGIQVLGTTGANTGGTSAGGGNMDPNIPNRATAACMDRLGRSKFSNVDQITALKPGYWEVIMSRTDGNRVACTVDRHGAISDWVNMH
jgi:hypothetical protein